MPELPDVEMLKRTMQKALGRRIEGVRIANTRIIRGTPEGAFKKALAGHSLEKTGRHGKYLFTRIKNSEWLLMHFGMTGGLVFFPSSESEPAHTRFLISFTDGNSLAYTSIRLLGKVLLVKDMRSYITGHNIGPDALSITLQEFRDALWKTRRNIKTALMDQKILAGIGNIYSDEILYQARISPDTRVDKLSEPEIKKIYSEMRGVLETAIRRDAGAKGFPPDFLIPRRRAGADCPNGCGKVERQKISGRSAYFCPACQK